MQAYHYTTRYLWDIIQDNGELNPTERSLPLFENASENVSEQVRNICNKGSRSRHSFAEDCTDKFVCALFEPVPPGWVKYDLFTGLLNMILNRGRTKNDLILLELRPGSLDDMFIRDAKLISPVYTSDKYGIANFLGGTIEDTYFESPAFNKMQLAAYKEYYESTVPLHTYAYDYEAPELWLPRSIPLSAITEIPLPRNLWPPEYCEWLYAQKNPPFQK
jgi:hypothetical protein